MIQNIFGQEVLLRYNVVGGGLCTWTYRKVPLYFDNCHYDRFIPNPESVFKAVWDHCGLCPLLSTDSSSDPIEDSYNSNLLDNISLFFPIVGVIVLKHVDHS